MGHARSMRATRRTSSAASMNSCRSTSVAMPAGPYLHSTSITSTAMVADAGASSGKLYAIVAAPERQRRALSSCVSSASS